MTSLQDAREELTRVDFTKLLFSDLEGRLMSLLIADGNITHGVSFDGSSVPGFATVESSDRLLVPDVNSFYILNLPGEKVGLFVGQVYDEPTVRARVDPRAVLERVLAQAKSRYGCTFLVGPEYEFFLLAEDGSDEKSHSDDAGYMSAAPQDKGERVRNSIIDVLKKSGIGVKKAHHEVTPSQHEITLECVEPLSGADRSLVFKHVTKKVAAEQGFHASFMPKPFDGYNRNAFHIHLSMYDRDGRNVFVDEDSDHHLSKLAKHFIGGILRFARETSIIMASSFNSYKAYVASNEAPIARGWGVKNRSSMVRIPYFNSLEDTRIELRSPDAAGNVYLQFATFISMGLKGIEDAIDCGQPEIESAYARHPPERATDDRLLPRTMYEALVEAEGSTFLRELMGDQMYGQYMKLKLSDWEEHRTHVTLKEVKEYLDI